MDVPLLIKQRLTDLGLEQKDLAEAAQVTESYVSQLLAGRKMPPAPGRTDLYERVGPFLGLPTGELARLAEAQRQEELKKKVQASPAPLFVECRTLVLRKCHPARRREIRRIFEKETFGELERLVTQRILDVAQGIAREELRNEEWLRRLAEASDRSYRQMRVAILEFLDSDVFHVSPEGCVSFLDPMIESWDIDLKTFAIEITLNRRLTPGVRKRFEFNEVRPRRRAGLEPGLEEFLRDEALSAGVTEEEVEFLRGISFRGRRPSALYYYRELQSIRDPLHFPASNQEKKE